MKNKNFILNMRKCIITFFIAISCCFTFINSNYAATFDFSPNFENKLEERIVKYNITKSDLAELLSDIKMVAINLDYAEEARTKRNFYAVIYHYKQIINILDKISNSRTFIIISDEEMFYSLYASSYHNVGMLSHAKGRFQDAIFYLNNAEKYKQYLTPTEQFYTYFGKVGAYHVLNNKQKALEEAKKAQKMCDIAFYEKCPDVNNYIKFFQNKE